MKEWFTIAELAAAGLPGLPRTKVSLNNLALKQWRNCGDLARQVAGKTKPVWEYHISLLPPLARSRLVVVCGAAEIAASSAERLRAKAAWERFEGLTIEQQRICEERLKVLLFAADLRAGGLGVREAVAGAAGKFGVCQASIFNWQRLV